VCAPLASQLDLSNNRINGHYEDDGYDSAGYEQTKFVADPEGVQAIAGALRVNGALTKLSLAWNELGEEGTKAICEALKQNKTLKELDLSGRDNIGGEAGAKHVADMLGVNGGLTKLSLAENKLEEEGTKAICEALEQNTTLKELDMSGDRYGPSNIGGTAGAKHVAKMLGVNGALTVTNLLGDNLDAESAKMLAEVAKQKGISLCGIRRDQTTADFSNQALKLPDVILLASDLSQAVVTGGLTSIDLSENLLCGIWTDDNGDQQGTYTAEGITAIADALRVNGGLTSLNLSDNALCGVVRTFGELDDESGTYTAEGITAIADALRINGGLTSINLSNNQLCGVWTHHHRNSHGTYLHGTYTAEGITAIADAMRVNGLLTKIE
jgi:hypothetical protein